MRDAPRAAALSLLLATSACLNQMEDATDAGSPGASSSSSRATSSSSAPSSSGGVAPSSSSAPPPSSGVQPSSGPATSSQPASSAGAASSAAPSSSEIPPAGNDDAEFTADTLPRTLNCGQSITVTFTLHNLGDTTWTDADGYRLGAVDDADPFAGTRATLGASVAPGETLDVRVAFTAPSSEGTFTTDWRMLREGAHWFGGTASQDVVVSCAAAPAFDLASVTVVSSPDVRSFPVTSHITSLQFSPGTIHVDHEKRGQWPGVQIASDGTLQEATIWVFFAIGGTWYGTGGERLRPDQADKQLDNPSSIGPGWLYDPNRWGVMTNYVPAVGEMVGFMVVAGSTRSDNNVAVQERTGVVLVPFPPDNETTSFPPFAWQE